MKSPYHFIVIDSDQANCSISCKAIMQAARSAIIQTFSKPADGIIYIKEKHTGKEKNKIILFLNMDGPDTNTWEFMDDYGKTDEFIKKNTLMYLLSSNVTPQFSWRAGQFSFVKGFLSNPVSHEDLMLIFNKK